MTIRNQNYQLERNTDLDFYKEILLFMVSKGYEIVVIPDTGNFFDVDFVRDWPKCTIFPEASTNVLLRAAIYQLSSINIFPAGVDKTSTVPIKSSPFQCISTILCDALFKFTTELSG